MEWLHMTYIQYLSHTGAERSRLPCGSDIVWGEDRKVTAIFTKFHAFQSLKSQNSYVYIVSDIQENTLYAVA